MIGTIRKSRLNQMSYKKVDKTIFLLDEQGKKLIASTPNTLTFLGKPATIKIEYPYQESERQRLLSAAYQVMEHFYNEQDKEPN